MGIQINNNKIIIYLRAITETIIAESKNKIAININILKFILLIFLNSFSAASIDF